MFGFGISPERPVGWSGWGVSLSTSAFAQSLNCEYPPYDEPDGDGDECNDGYPQQLTPAKNLGGKDPDCSICALIGDPINYTNGSFYQEETDYTGGGPFPIVLKRLSNSQDFTGVHEFGPKWHSSYSRLITVTSPTTTVTARRDDGRIFTFTLTNGIWISDADVNSRLTKTASGWVYVTVLDETETYNANGQLVSLSNRAGLTQTFTYNPQGRLASATDPFGRVLTFSYLSSTSPLIAQLTAPDGGVYGYGYDANNRLISVTYPDNSKRQYVYENASYPNMLTGIIDENGKHYVSIVYDANGLATSSQHAGGADLFSVDYTYLSQGVTSVTNPLGGVTSYLLQGLNGSAKTAQTALSCSNCNSPVGGPINSTYDVNGNLSSQQDYNGNTTTYSYDLSRNLETSRTLASGTPIAETITTTWHPTYRLTTQVNEPNRTTRFNYDTHGNLLTTTITSPNITSTHSYTYNGAGQVLTATDPRGNVTSYAYDTHGNLSSVTNALGQTTLFSSYDANGRPLTIQDPNGIATTLTYNFRGQITSQTTLLRVTTFTYDAAGELIKLTRPDGSYLAYTYDAAHRLVGVADALGDTIAYTLDAAGNRIKEQVYDPNKVLAQTHSRAYDGLSRLYQDIGAQSQASTYYYDANGNLTQFYNPVYADTYRYFDALNRLIQVNDPNYNSTFFKYDAKSRLSSVTDPRGLMTSYGNNGLDLQTSISSPDAGVQNKTYDTAGNVITATDGNGKMTSYAYDALNRVTQATLANGNVITYQYDQGSFGINHLTSLSDPTGNTTWGYNRYGQVNLKQQTVGAVALKTQWMYTANTGLLASITYPSGSTAYYTYDANGRVSTISYQKAGGGATVALLSQIKYQPFGPVASWVMGNGASYSRTFDQDGRITALALPAKDTIALSYDAASRITGMTETGLPAKSFGYDYLDRLTSNSSGSTSQHFNYDANGNRTGYSTSNLNYAYLNYTYDTASNHLLSASGSWNEHYTYDNAGNVLTHTTPTANYAFAYNVRNRLNQSTVGTAVQNYNINGLGQRVAKVTPSTGAQTTFIYDEAGHLIGRYNSTVGFEETVWLGDLLAAMLEPAGPYYIAPDHLGAPHQVTDGNQQVVWFWDHDPFGNGQPTGSLATYKGRFPGQFYDSETGLNYNYFRDYDPTTGRYIQSDPIGLRGGVNTYTYVKGNPVSGVDPLGLMCNSTGCWTTPAERSALNNGGYAAYYQTACADGDAYACFAQHIAANDNVLGNIATNRVSDALNSKQCLTDDYESATMNQIRNDLANAYANYLPSSEAAAFFPMAEGVAQFHWDEFAKFGLPPETFGGTPFGKTWLVLPALWCPNCQW